MVNVDFAFDHGVSSLKAQVYPENQALTMTALARSGAERLAYEPGHYPDCLIRATDSAPLIRLQAAPFLVFGHWDIQKN
jgi:hypothetical protein